MIWLFWSLIGSMIGFGMAVSFIYIMIKIMDRRDEVLKKLRGGRGDIKMVKNWIAKQRGV